MFSMSRSANATPRRGGPRSPRGRRASTAARLAVVGCSRRSVEANEASLPAAIRALDRLSTARPAGAAHGASGAASPRLGGMMRRRPSSPMRGATVGAPSVLLRCGPLYSPTPLHPHMHSSPFRRPRAVIVFLLRRCAAPARGCSSRCSRRSLFGLVAPHGRERGNGLEADGRHRRAAARLVLAAAVQRTGSITRACSSAGARCTPRGSAEEAEEWLDAAQAAGVDPLVSFGHSRAKRRELPRSRASRARSGASRALSVGARLRDLERGQPLRRADVPPARARRRLLARDPARMPELPRPRRRAARPAEHGLVGAGLPPRRARPSRSSGACTTTSTPTAAHDRLTRAMLRATKRQDVADRDRRHRRRNNRSRVALPGVARPRREGDALRLRAARAASSPRIKRVYLYHWNDQPGPRSWDSALVAANGRSRGRLTTCFAIVCGGCGSRGISRA